MTQIRIPMNAWSRQQLRKRTKTCTTRTKKYGSIGDTFKVGFQEYVITDIHKTILHDVAGHFWKAEGANSEEDFINIWSRIHFINKFNPAQFVWIHFFEECI